MTKLEALAKALIWRIFIAIPIAIGVSYYYLDSISEATELAIVANVISTVLYYLFDVMWFSKFTGYFEYVKKDNK
tara:strand:+ start:1577 stop:1801 length:225 start_codon:yes stop_codon:yes gene_type:complete